MFKTKLENNYKTHKGLLEATKTRKAALLGDLSFHCCPGEIGPCRQTMDYEYLHGDRWLPLLDHFQRQLWMNQEFWRVNNLNNLDWGEGHCTRLSVRT